MTESQLKCRVVSLLKRELAGAWVHHPSEKFVSGIPDLFILYRGVFAAIELKVGKNKATRLQVHTLERLSNAGAITAICYNLEEVQRVVHRIVGKAIKEGGNGNV